MRRGSCAATALGRSIAAAKEEIEAEVLPPAEDGAPPKTTEAVDLGRFEEGEDDEEYLPPPKPRKLTKREQEERDLRLQRARERREVLSIFRKLDHADLERLMELEWSWTSPDLHRSMEWADLQIELFPDIATRLPPDLEDDGE